MAAVQVPGVSRVISEIITKGIDEISGVAGHRRARAGLLEGIKKSLADIERHHKRSEMIRKAGGRLSSGDIVPPDPYRITVRTGTLSRSYTRRIDKQALIGSYGSDLVYAPVHEFGSPAKNIRSRPGLQRTIDKLQDQIEKTLADATLEGLNGK
jgi:hypothetical protein